MYLDPQKIKPTPTHYFIKLLEKNFLLYKNITMNVDNLEH